MIQKIVKFMQDSGAMALAWQRDVDFFKSELKTDGVYDVVTDVDITITKMFREFVAREFGDLDYIIADEETIMELGADPFAELNRHEYVFIIDPLDGTLTYSNGLQFWGIIIGVFKKGQPVAGAVYAPALDTLVYADEKAAYSIEKGEMRELKPLPDNVDSPPLIIINSFITMGSKPDINFKEVQPLQFYSGAVNMLQIALNRARGYWFTVHMWDVAGFLMIFKHVGIEVRGINDNKELSILDSKSYKPTGMLVNQRYIVSRPKYYDYLKNIAESVTKG